MNGRKDFFGKISERLGERDWMIIASIHERRYLTTRQLARQFFHLNKTATAIPRQANHTLARLRELGLLANLLRRVGGVRAGSAGHVWALTDTGSRLLAWHQHRPADPRIREYEPSPAFLEHTLAIAEVILNLTEIAAERNIHVVRVQFEPAAWRMHLGFHGATVTLKPDLAVTTRTEGNEADEWFIEVDRATEAPGRIVRKCFAYQDYRRTGIEQKRLGVFPAVIWIVPGTTRKNQLRQRLAAELRLDSRLFIVITPDELGDLIQAGAENYITNPGGQNGGHPS